MSKGTMNIHVHHITRVEGHGDIVVDAQNGQIKSLRLDIVEAPRLFEAMLKGHRYDEVHHIACRICGICSVSHTTASLRATEAAMGIELSEQTLKLRKLIYHAEMIQSHVLHVYFLVAPDLLGVPSVFPLIQTHKDVVLMAMRMKKLANDACAVIGGRHVHPITLIPGRFAKLPDKKDLADLKRRYEAMVADVNATVDLIKTLQIPAFERETEYVSLTLPEEFAFIEGDIKSSHGDVMPPERYREVTNEYVVPHSTAKHARWHRSSYMVGSLARVNNNYPLLNRSGKAAAEALGLKAPCYNSFMNSIAQVVETAHCAEDSLRLLNELLDSDLAEERDPIPIRAGRGVGIVEAPRGILFHDYEYDDDGRIVQANCIIPTGQNFGNIEDDFRKITPTILDRPREEVAHTLEVLVRAYDPCISCSVHLLDGEET